MGFSLKKKHIYICLLGILCIAVAIYVWRTSQQDGFQVRNCNVQDAPAAAARFWQITANKDTDAMSAKITKVSSPDPSDPNDNLPIQFSQYISMYALARRATSDDLSGARADLITCYDTLQKEMQTNLYDSKKRAAWDASPIAESCKKLDALRGNYLVQYAILNKQLQDLSGTEIIGEQMRDENMAYQTKLIDKCKVTPMSAACQSLASQEGPVFELLAKYDYVNTSLLSDATDISNNLLTINQVYNALGCKYPNQFFSTGIGAPVFWVDNNTKYPVPSSAAQCSVGNMDNKYLAPTIAPQSFFDSCKTSKVSFSCDMLSEKPPWLEILDSKLPLVDTTSLRMKLENMSPYFLSPDIVDFITSSNLGDTDATKTIPDILVNLSSVIGRIKRYTNTP